MATLYDDISLGYHACGGSKVGKLHSFKPTDGSGDFAVTRAGTTAFTQTPDNYWKPAAANEPRFTYTNGVRALLVEGAATRLNTHPFSFENAAWTKSGVRVEGDPATAGSDILAGWNFTVGFNTSSAVINDSNTFTTAAAGGLTKLSIITVGKFYLCRIKGDTSAVVFNLQTTTGGIIYQQLTGSFDIEFYFQAQVNQDIFLRNVTAGTTNIDIFSVKEVSGFDCPFVDANGINTKQGRKLVEYTNNGNHYINNTPPLSITTGTIISVSAIAKYAGRHLFLYDNAAVDVNASFNLQNGTLIFKAANVISTTIKEENDGYYKVTITYAVQNNLANLRLYTHNGSTISYQGDGVSGVIVSGFFVEAGTVATSPIGGAEGATQTRNADFIENTTTTSITSDDFTFMIDLTEIINYVASGNFYILLRNSTGTSSIGLTTLSSTDNALRLYAKSNNIVQFDYNFGNRSRGLIIIRMLSNTYSLFYNGQKLNLPANSSLRESFTTLRLSGVYCSFKISDFFYIKTALTDQQCIQLTTL